MKNLFLFIAIILSLSASAQVYQGYPQYGMKIKRTESDSTLHSPYGTIPGLRGGTNRPGGLFFKTVDSSLQIYTGYNWLKLADSLQLLSSRKLSRITPSAETNTIDNANYKQEWQWSTLTNSGTGFKLSASPSISGGFISTQKLVDIELSGTMTGGTLAKSIALNVTNSQNGTVKRGIEVNITGTGGGTTGVLSNITSSNSTSSAILARNNAAGRAGDFSSHGDTTLSVLNLSTGQASATGLSIRTVGATYNRALLVKAGLSAFLTTADTALAIVHIGGSNTDRSALSIESGTAPTSPNNGDIWHASNHLFARLNGATYQIDQQSSSTDIYSADGTLSSARTVDNAGYPLTFKNASLFRIIDTANLRGGIQDINEGIDYLTFNPDTSYNFTQDILTGIKLTANNIDAGTSKYLQVKIDGIYGDGFTHSGGATEKMLVWDSTGKKILSRAIPSGGSGTDGNGIYGGSGSLTVNTNIYGHNYSLIADSLEYFDFKSKSASYNSYSRIRSFGKYDAATGGVWNIASTSDGSDSSYVAVTASQIRMRSAATTYTMLNMASTVDTSYKIMVRNSSGDVKVMTNYGPFLSWGGGTSGIDDVLAIAQALTANRTVDISGFSFDLGGIFTQFQVDDAGHDINITASDDLNITAGDILLSNLDALHGASDSMMVYNPTSKLVGFRPIPSGGSGEANTASNLGGGLANFSGKSGVDLQFNSFLATDFDLSSNTIAIDYTNGQAAGGGQKGFLTATDWNTFNNKTPTSRTISTLSPLTGGGDLTGNLTLSIANAAADATTKGASTYTAADFNASSGLISLDYANGQIATGSVNGFMSTSLYNQLAAVVDSSDNNFEFLQSTVGAPVFKVVDYNTTRVRTFLDSTNIGFKYTDTTITGYIKQVPGVFILAASDETTAITTGTGKLTFRVPFACTVTAVRLTLTTVSSSGLPTIDINEGGATILSTKLTCDASEKTSTTAATAAVISDTSLADDAEITIDFDVAGTGATGVKVYIYYTRNL
jgi:hypothetical protein